MKLRGWLYCLLIPALSWACATAGDAVDGGDSDAGNPGSLDAAVAGMADGAPTVHPDATPPADAAARADAVMASCLDPVDVTAGGTFASESTAGATDDLSPPTGSGCPAGGLASGPDVAYVVKPAVDTLYDVTVTPGTGSYDPMVYAMPGCDFEIGCYGGSILNGPGEPEAITFAAGAGETVYVIVDGETGTSGPYSMQVDAMIL